MTEGYPMFDQDWEDSGTICLNVDKGCMHYVLEEIDAWIWLFQDVLWMVDDAGYACGSKLLGKPGQPQKRMHKWVLRADADWGLGTEGKLDTWFNETGWISVKDTP